MALSLKGILGVWVWAPLVGLHWVALTGLLLAWGPLRGGAAHGPWRYFPPSRGGWLWKLLLTLLGLAALPMMFLANTLVVGLLFGVAAWRLKSLRWPVFAHFLVDLFSLSVPVFLNLYTIAA